MADTDPKTDPKTDPAVDPATDPKTDPKTDPAVDPAENALGDAGKKALQQERAARTAAEKLAAEREAKIKEYEDRDKTEAQKLTDERDALKNENEKLRIETLRRDVAAEKGIDPKAIGRLQGTTREELEADADALLQILKPGKAPFGDVGQGTRNAGAGRVYTRAELNDHTFFVKNKEDILLAQTEGRITD